MHIKASWNLICWIIICVLLTACQPSQPKGQGYIEGQYRYISATYSGVLRQLNVQRGAQIKKNQLLFVLDAQPESDALKQAEQQVQHAQAQLQQSNLNLALAQKTYERQQILYQKKLIDKQTLDKLHTDYLTNQTQVKQNQANLNNVQAALTRAQWSQQQKIIYAPINGIVFDSYYLPGELVPAGHPVVSLLAPQDIKIIFYVSETQLSQLKLDQTIQLNCDGCAKHLTAKINYISPQAEFTPPVIYSNDTRSKMVFRIEAAPINQQGQQLHPGQPVAVTW